MASPPACALLASALLLASIGPARAQPAGEPASPPRPTADQRPLSIEAGLGLYTDPTGAIHPGSAPVWVALENRGATVQVELEVALHDPRQSERQRRVVELPAGQSRREWFLLPTPGDCAWEVTVRGPAGKPLYSSGQRGLAARSPRRWIARGYVEPPHVVEIVDPAARPGAAEWFPPAALYARVSRVTPAQLPPLALAWSGVDVVVLHEVDLGALSQPQFDALRAWLLAGGQLLLIPGERLSWLRSPELLRLSGPLPVEDLYSPLSCLATAPWNDPGQPQEFPWRDVHLVRLDRPLRAQAAAFPPRQRLLDGRDLELIQSVRRGEGAVHLVAFDLTQPAFQQWSGAIDFLSTLRELLGSAQLAGSEHPGLQSQDTSRLVDSRRAPALWPVLVLLGVYVTCVGPLNGWLLRRRNAQPLLVVTVPALSLLFCLVVFAGGAWFRGSSLTVWQVRRLWAWAGTPQAHELTMTSLLSGVEGQATLRVPSDLVLSRRPPLQGGDWDGPLERRDPGDGVSRAAVPLRAWEPTCFEAHGLRDLGQGLRVEPDPQRPRLVNASPLTLGRVVWRQREGLFRGPERVEPGQTVRLEPWLVAEDQLQSALAAHLSGSNPGQADPQQELVGRALVAWGIALRGPGLLAVVEGLPGLEVEGHPPDRELTLLELWGGVE